MSLYSILIASHVFDPGWACKRVLRRISIAFCLCTTTDLLWMIKGQNVVDSTLESLYHAEPHLGKCPAERIKVIHVRHLRRGVREILKLIQGAMKVIAESLLATAKWWGINGSTWFAIENIVCSFQSILSGYIGKQKRSGVITWPWTPHTGSRQWFSTVLFHSFEENAGTMNYSKSKGNYTCVM